MLLTVSVAVVLLAADGFAAPTSKPKEQTNSVALNTRSPRCCSPIGAAIGTATTLGALNSAIGTATTLSALNSAWNWLSSGDKEDEEHENEKSSQWSSFGKDKGKGKGKNDPSPFSNSNPYKGQNPGGYTWLPNPAAPAQGPALGIGKGDNGASPFTLPPAQSGPAYSPGPSFPATNGPNPSFSYPVGAAPQPVNVAPQPVGAAPQPLNGPPQSFGAPYAFSTPSNPNQPLPPQSFGPQPEPGSYPVWQPAIAVAPPGPTPV